MPNPTYTIPNSSIAVRFKVGAFDDSSNPKPFQNGTAKISDTSFAYVVQAPDGQIYVQPNPANYPTTPGSSVTVSVKINGQSAVGTPLPEFQIDVVLQGPPVPPQATNFQVTSGPEFSDTFPVPPDPGTDTITIV